MNRTRIHEYLDGIGVPKSIREDVSGSALRVDETLRRCGVSEAEVRKFDAAQREQWAQAGAIGAAASVSIWFHLSLLPAVIQGAPDALDALATHWDKLSFVADVHDAVGLDNALTAIRFAGELLWDNPELAGFAWDAVELGMDIFADGMLTAGVGIAAGFVVKFAFEKYNGDKEEQLAALQTVTHEIDKLEILLRKRQPAPVIAAQLQRVPAVVGRL